MSKNGFLNRANYHLSPPAVSILQYSLVRNFLQWQNPNRNAPFWRLYRSLTLGARIRVRGCDYDLTPEKVCLIPPNTSYSSDAWHPFSQFYMHFTWSEAENYQTPLFLPVSDGFHSFHDVECFFSGSDYLLSVKMYAFLYRYLSLISSIQQTQVSAMDSRIMQAIQIMNANIKLRNRDIASAVSLSCDAFQRLFKREMGTSARQYMISRRMEMAQSLLVNSTTSIEEIALTTGFTNRYQFSKAFAAYFKVPPVSYRKGLRV